MEEMATFSIANSLSENTSLGNHVGFTRVKLLTETASLLSDMASKDSKDGILDQVNEVDDVMPIVNKPVDENLVKLPSVVANSVSLPIVEKSHGKGVKSVYELEYIPLWGSHSIIGKRPEMEDAVAVVPRFMEVPIKMFVGDHVVDGVNSSLTNLTTHFFGVYDGHGGSQVYSFDPFNYFIFLNIIGRCGKMGVSDGLCTGLSE